MSPVAQVLDVSMAYEAGRAWSRRKTTVVRSVSLTVDDGRTLGLVGESGSGKSTLAKILLGLLEPTSGQALLDGEPVRKRLNSQRGQVQVVPQHPEWALNPRLLIWRSIAEPLAVTGTARGERRERSITMLERVGLHADLAQRYPHELSGGQRQRVSIARALITQPRFIVFDEAVSALDVSVQAQILNLVRSLQNEQHFAMLFISHDLGAVRYVSHEVAIMRAGELIRTVPADVTGQVSTRCSV